MEYHRTFTREFDLGAAPVLDIEGRSGTIAVRGQETDRVKVEVVARVWAENNDDADEQADAIERGIQGTDERLTIRSPSLPRVGVFFIITRGPRIDYLVTVPKGASGTVSGRSGRIEVADIKGPLEIGSRSGKVTLRHIGGDVTVASRSGSLDAEEIDGSLSVQLRSGSVKVRECRGDLTVASRSGSCRAEDVGGDVQVSNRSGAIVLAEVLGAVSVRTGSGAVRYRGPIKGPFDVDVSSGAIVLAVNPHDRFFLDAESYSGAVRSELPLRRSPAEAASGEPGPTVRLRTRSGAIRIVPV